MQQVVEQLLDRGFRLYVLSNCGYCFRQLQYLIPHEEQFSGMLVSAEEKLLKPDPAIFARFCDKFDVRAEECLFIDDLPRNVEGAKAAGMQGYCFADGDVNRLTQFLQQLDA